jgi:hypothetical protein
MGILSSITGAIQNAGTMVEAYLAMVPGASESECVSFCQKNADVIVGDIIKNPILDAIGDEIANEIISSEVPALYAKAMLKLGGIPPVTALQPSATPVSYTAVTASPGTTTTTPVTMDDIGPNANPPGA